MVISSGQATQNASPLFLIIFGFLFAGLGAARIYAKIAANRNSSNSLLRNNLDESPLRRLGAAGPIGIGFMLMGIFVIVIGVVHAFE
jgi:hypothetical protein